MNKVKNIMLRILCLFAPKKEWRKKLREACIPKEPRAYLEYLFDKKMDYPLNLDNPKTFNEKLQWLKLNYTNELMPICADKYRVRKYLEELGAGKYLIPLLDVADRFEDLDWDNLPDQFVIKANHDSGSVWVIKDKSSADKEMLKDAVNKALSKSYGAEGCEFFYNEIPPKVVVEQFLEEDDKTDLKDYKIFCFHGLAHFIQIDFDRFTDHSRTFYDRDWNKLPFSSHGKLAKKDCNQPEALQEMLTLAEKISKPFPHARIDLYYTNHKIYFGEITFCHGGGLELFSSREWDIKFGNLLKLTIL